jgi:metal-responsive CopG/Arc/MetJ family transcriptional regulator
MEKDKRSYFLPNKLVAAFDKEAQKQGYVREKVIAAAIAQFLRSGPTERAAMFEDLDKLVSGKAK